MLTQLFSGNNPGAQIIPDSLLQKLNNAANDSVIGIRLLETGEAIEETTPGKSIDYYRQALLTGLQEVGYRDFGFFRNILKRLTGLTPQEYKKKYVQMFNEAVVG